MSLWEERKFLETDPDYLFSPFSPKKGLYTLPLLQLQRTSTDT